MTHSAVVILENTTRTTFPPTIASEDLGTVGRYFNNNNFFKNGTNCYVIDGDK